MLKKNLGLVIFGVLCLATSFVHAQLEPVVWTDDQIRQILSNRIDVEKQAVGIVVGLIDINGKRVISHGSTLASKPSQKPDGDTVFEIGSVSKVFTSLLLADMVVKGEVALDDPVSKYLPKTVTMPKRDGSEISLLSLSTHTSALPRMPSNLAPSNPKNPYADYTVEMMYSFLSGLSLTKEIGKTYEYSNLGAGLLGHALALRAGTDYETLVSTRVTKPLGMASTSIALTADMQRRLAIGHDESLAAVSNWDIPTFAGAGAIRSTANDMLLLLEASMGKKKSPLDSAMTQQKITRKPTGQPNLSMALGWHKLSKFGDVVWHNGQTGGYHSFVGFDEKRGVGVVVLCNTGADIDDIALHLLDTRFPLKQPTLKVDPKVLDSYVGDYELIPTFVISITKQGDRLMLQATGQPKFEIFAESESKFFLKVVDAKVSFVKNKAGAVSELILHQNGANQVGKKKMP